MVQLAANYREVMAYQIYTAAGFLVAPFSVLGLWREQYLTAVPSFIVSALCLINMAGFRWHGRFYVDRVVISVLYILNLSIIVHKQGTDGAYWAFPTLLALYWVHERQVAVYLVTLFFVAVCSSAFMSLSVQSAIRIAATLVTTAIFFNIASRVLEQHYSELKKMSVTDHLTGAYNRRYMDLKIDELIERQRRFHSDASLITLDIDHFKEVNDKFGHSVGDGVLVQVVELITSRVRILDIVCRSGGEEFVVILPDTPEARGRMVGEELRQSIGDSPLLAGHRITVSCGVSGLVPGDSRDSWLHRCDQALYAAKHGGRNTVAVKEPVFDDGLAKA